MVGDADLTESTSIANVLFAATLYFGSGYSIIIWNYDALILNR